MQFDVFRVSFQYRTKSQYLHDRRERENQGLKLRSAAKYKIILTNILALVAAMNGSVKRIGVATNAYRNTTLLLTFAL